MTIRGVYTFTSAGALDFTNEKREISKQKQIRFRDGWVFLRGGCYKVMYNEIIEVPRDCVGMAFPRSSLLRCGVSLHCAIWDPGYRGRSESLLVVHNDKGFRLKKNARIAQIVFLKLGREAEGYKGRYRNENI